MSDSTSSPTNTTQTATTVSTTNQNVTGNAGPVSIGGGSVSSNSGNTTNTDVKLNTSNTTSTTDSHNISTTDSHNDNSVNYTTTSDSGAIAAGQSLGSAGLKTAQQALTNESDLTSQIANESTGLARSAFDTATSLNASSNNFAGQTVASYQGAVSDLAFQFSNGLTQLEQQSSAQVGNTVTALNQIAVQADTSANQQVINAVTQSQQSLQTIVKYAAIAVGVIAVVYLLAKKG